MEENEPIDPEYLKGFNEGYLITKELPELAEQLKSLEAASPRLQGYKDGREQYHLERSKELLPNWLKGDREIIKDINKEKDRDKDMEQ